MNHPALPARASIEDGTVFVAPGLAYEEALTALGVTDRTQYWLEVARRCCTERLHIAVKGSLDLMNAIGGTGLHLRILRDDNYRLDLYPEGEGAEAGSRGFRKHYQTYLNNLTAG